MIANPGQAIPSHFETTYFSTTPAVRKQATMGDIPIRHITTPQKEPDFSENFTIRDVRNLLAGGDMIQELHRHDFFYILALEKGAGHHEIDFTPYPVGDRSIFVMRPGQVHHLVLKTESAGYLMGFKTDFYYPSDKASYVAFRRAGNKNLYQPDAKRFHRLLSILTYVFEEYNDKQDGYQEVIKANLAIFFVELLRHEHHPKSAAHNAISYEQQRLEEFLELLETHIATHKQVSAYADMLNLSTYQLNAITKATLGKTCSELINEHIILESKRYLLATPSQVNQIAYRLGYEDASYFIRFFRKHVGYTPEAFRHNFK